VPPTIRSMGSRLRHSTLARNATTLYFAHFVGLLLPLVAVPYLARVLRPEGWGLVVFAQSFSAWLALVLEYGFYLSGTRRIARLRHSRGGLARVVAGVQSAKALLLVVISAGALVAYLLVPVFRDNPGFLFWAWIAAMAQGLSPFWFFQGVERMRAPALAEAGGKAAATAGIFLLVREPADGWIVLALQAVTGLAAVALTTRWVYREVPFRRLRLRRALATLRQAAGLFVFRTASGAYIVANSFIVGVLASPQVVAYFGGAERIIRGAINLVHPATQAIYPRISRLVVDDRSAAGRLLALSLVLVGTLGVAVGAGAWLAAPHVVRVLLGPGYEAAVPVLRVLGLLPPITAVTTVLGIQWALPMGYERYVLRLVAAAGVLNAVLAILVVPRHGALGMAVVVVLAECLVTTGLVVLAWRRGRDVWRAGLLGLVFPARRPPAAAPAGAQEAETLHTTTV
jgi:polysaccharide transporter, PST family